MEVELISRSRHDPLIAHTAAVYHHRVSNAGARNRKESAVQHPTFYRTVRVDGYSIFYREAGPKDAPTLLLLHGLPSSSRMFEPLFARLSDRYHLVAPDYPGFGHSDWPDPKTFAYTFDHYAEIITHFTEALGLGRYSLYMQDYGGPVGFRMALTPERRGADRPDAVAHNEGLAPTGRHGARSGPIAPPTRRARQPLVAGDDAHAPRRERPGVERYDRICGRMNSRSLPADQPTPERPLTTTAPTWTPIPVAGLMRSDSRVSS